MPGGELQLAARGAQDFYLTDAPTVTFFKQRLARHTNFAMEHITTPLNTTDVNCDQPTQFTLTVERVGDLLIGAALVLDLPPVYCDSALAFRWIPFLGELIVDDVQCIIGATVVERQYGEWMHIWTQLTLPLSKLNLHHRMIGHAPALFDPESVNNNTYPLAAFGDATPSIAGRKLVVPFTLWFCRTLGAAVKLCALQRHLVQLRFTLKPVRAWYRLLYSLNGAPPAFHAPQLLDPTHAPAVFLQNPAAPATGALDMGVHLELHYVFLDDWERGLFERRPHFYLVEQLQRFRYVELAGTRRMDMGVFNPLKEMVYIARPSGIDADNDFTTYLAADGGEPVLSTTLYLNGKLRLQEKPGEFFTLLQPYTHHSSSPQPGIGVYSFALQPEGFQPSGQLNMTRFGKLQAVVQFRGAGPYDWTMYATTHNFVEVRGGMGSTKYAT
jgi:hypothetical protein